jgi:transcriptional regulator with XRE-family HTH domain
MGDLSDVMATILAANIKTLRLSEGATQVEFAEKLNVSQGTVARWESGSKPEVEHIVKMARMAGVAVQDFTGQLITTERRQFAEVPPGVLLLPVQLPNAEALTDMFEGLLETMPAGSDLRVTAQRLAQLLPNALARTVSHSQVGTESTDPLRPEPEAPEGPTISDPSRTR